MRVYMINKDGWIKEAGIFTTDLPKEIDRFGKKYILKSIHRADKKPIALEIITNIGCWYEEA